MIEVTEKNYDALKRDCLRKYAEANQLANALDIYYKTTDKHRGELRKIIHDWVDIDENGNPQINLDRAPTYNAPINLDWEN